MNKKLISILALMGVGSYTNTVLQALIHQYSTVGIIRILVGQTKCELYERQKGKVWEYSFPLPYYTKKKIFLYLTMPLSLLIQYFTIILMGIILARKAKVSFSVCIGEFYTGAICGIFLKKIGFIKKVIYWAIDWFPQRSLKEVQLLTFIGNSLAHPYLDRISATKSDTTWNFTQRIINARHNRWKTMPLNIPVEKVITPPLLLRNSKLYNLAEKKKRVGYIGILKEGQGIELAIETISHLKKEGIELNLDIIGTSRYEQYFRDYAKKLDAEENVVFHGYLDDQSLANIVESWICGLSLFEGGEKNYSYYTWSSKIGMYLSYGLPVVMTRVPEIADEIEREKAGIIVYYDVKSVSTAICRLAIENDKFIEYQGNVIKFVTSRMSGNTIIQSINELA